MKRDESVFFFTLVDFLITALFFGLVLYALAAPAFAEATSSQEEATMTAEALAAATGISDLTELTDRLTRLGPVKDLETTVNVVRKAGGLAEVQRTQLLIKEAGGFDSVAAVLAKLRREGFGVPPCRYTLRADGQKIPTVVATVSATDTSVTFVARTPVLDTIVARLAVSFAAVESLPLREFRRVFSPLVRQYPDCRFHIRFIEQTRYVDARDAVSGAGFRLNIVRR